MELVRALSDPNTHELGDINNPSPVYVKLEYDLKTAQGKPVMRLHCIWVAPELRRQGIASRVLDLLEERCRAAGTAALVVGPLMEDEETGSSLEGLLIRRGYEPCPPFSRFKRFKPPANQ